MAFLSLLDDRAKPKGSRDPLGFELVWTHFGRSVIGNLTTITSSLNNFAVGLLGFHWANQLQAHLPESERPARIRETFLRYEQLAAYLRFLANDKQLMGISRVTQRMSDGNKLSFGLDTDQQILSDQASYGIWGLYSAALRSSGLVEGNERVPTAEGMAIIERIERKLGAPHKAALIDVMTSRKTCRIEQLQAYAKPYLQAIRDKTGQEILLNALMNGRNASGPANTRPNGSLQSELWTLTRQLAEKNASIDDLPGYIAHIRSAPASTELQRRFDAIEAVERLLVATNNVFHYCRRNDGETLAALIHQLDAKYDYAHLEQPLDLQGVPRAQQLTEIRTALVNRDHGSAIKSILELNKTVMADRNGAPWVEIERGDTLRVRMKSDNAQLLEPNALLTHWDYEYFISSFVKIASHALGRQWKTL